MADCWGWPGRLGWVGSAGWVCWADLLGRVPVGPLAEHEVPCRSGRKQGHCRCQPFGALRIPGRVVLVDDGSCPPGQLRELTGSTPSFERQSRFVRSISGASSRLENSTILRVAHPVSSPAYPGQPLTGLRPWQIAGAGQVGSAGSARLGGSAGRICWVESPSARLPSMRSRAAPVASRAIAGVSHSGRSASRGASSWWMMEAARPASSASSRAPRRVSSVRAASSGQYPVRQVPSQLHPTEDVCQPIGSLMGKWWAL